MKRFICVILAVILLSSCGVNDKKIIQPELSVNSEVAFEKDGVLYSVEIVNIDADKTDFKFILPKELKGLCAEVANSSCKLEFDNVAYNYAVSAVSPDLRVLYSAVRCIELNKPEKITKTNSGSQIYYDDGTVIKADEENFVVGILYKNNKYTITRS